VAAVAVVGVVSALFAGIVAGITNCKQISDGMVEGTSYMRFKDHTDKIGYQHAVGESCFGTGQLCCVSEHAAVCSRNMYPANKMVSDHQAATL
jgi:hypothetical protein